MIRNRSYSLNIAESLCGAPSDKQLCDQHGLTKKVQINLVKLKFDCSPCRSSGNSDSDKQLLRDFGINQEVQIKLTKLEQTAVFPVPAYKWKKSIYKQNLATKNWLVCTYFNCDFHTWSITKQRDHLITVHNEKHFKCSSCPESFRDKRSVKLHEQTHLGVKVYKCKVDGCKYSCNLQQSLKLHSFLHTGEKPFECELKSCKKRFTRRERLKQHVLVHHTPKLRVRSHKCSMCEFKTYNYTMLNSHIRMHTGEKPYKCQFCEYSASRSGELQKHTRIHTGVKPFSCKQCNKKFRLTSHRKAHEQTHSNEKPFACRYCSFKCKTKFGLKNHERRMHI